MISKEQAEQLKRPFALNELDWRIAQAGVKGQTPWAKIFCYIDGRAVMDRLDEVFGVGCWSHSIRPVEIAGTKGSTLSGIISRLEGDGWHHEDLAQMTDIEALKGGASGALKRTAVHIGIGRYLYGMGDTFAIIYDRGRYYHSGKGGEKPCPPFRWDPPENDLPEWMYPPEIVQRTDIRPTTDVGEAELPPPPEDTVLVQLDGRVGTVTKAFFDQVGGMEVSRVKRNYLAKREVYSHAPEWSDKWPLDLAKNNLLSIQACIREVRP